VSAGSPLSPADARAITKTALAAASFADVSVRITARRAAHMRFAAGAPTTSGEATRFEVSVTAAQDGRVATVSGTGRDKESLQALVREAEALAKLAPVDPEHQPPLGPQSYAKVAARDAKTAEVGPEGRTEVVARVLKVARDAKLVASGLVEHEDSVTALANRAGLFALHTATQASLTTTMRTPDGKGSGWAGGSSHRLTDLDAPALARRAAEKAAMSAQGVETLKPGAYTVVLEAQAVADLLEFLVSALQARAADEGRSFFSRPGGNAIGEALFDPRVTLRSDPADPRHPSIPFAGDGQPLPATTWIERGVLKSLAYSRFWAKKQGVAPLPGPRSIFLSAADPGEEKDLLELVRGVERGVLVTRLWYNRMLEPRQILATGLTRDGTFLIEQGKIARPVKNMRYNESPAALLKNLVALGRPERTAGDGLVAVVPPLVAREFHFASVSDAV
jgi:predicted Zn-dependent protease